MALVAAVASMVGGALIAQEVAAGVGRLSSPPVPDNADFVIDTTSKGLPLSGEANGLLHA